MVKGVGCFCRGAPSLMFDRILNATLRRFPPLGLDKRISLSLCLSLSLSLSLSPSLYLSLCLLILLIHTKNKTIRWNFALTPRFYSLEGELIHWVDKAKNVWLIAGQLPIKAGWWDAPSRSGILAEVINKTIFSSNAVVTFIVLNDSA